MAGPAAIDEGGMRIMVRQGARMWSIAGRAGATFAVAVGVGRFVYTPILPLMQAQTSLPSEVAALLATSNYAGYFAGALLMTLVPGLVRSRIALRVSILAVVVSLAAMPWTTEPIVWMLLRGMAGTAGAVLFVIAIAVVSTGIAPTSRAVAGWAYGGVGAGIAVSGAAVLIVGQVADWRTAWWTAAAVAGILATVAWRILGPAVVAPLQRGAGAAPSRRGRRGAFALLAATYLLEGLGYIIAGTFLVTAVRPTVTGPLGSSIWIVAGAAAVPSTVVWTRLGARMSHPSRLVLALVLQAVGILCATLPLGAAGAVVAAVLFGATFMGVATIALEAGRELQVPGAIALLSALYAVGQLAGPVIAAPLVADGFAPALIVSGTTVALAALLAALLRFLWASGPQNSGDTAPGSTGSAAPAGLADDSPELCRGGGVGSAALRCGGTPRTGRWAPARPSRASGTRA